MKRNYVNSSLTFVSVTLALCLALVSCVHLRSVAATPFPAQKGKEIEATSSKFVFLGITFSNAYVDEAVTSLSRQCPKGRIEGIVTKDELVDYFLFIFTTQRVTLRGQCMMPKGAA